MIGNLILSIHIKKTNIVKFETLFTCKSKYIPCDNQYQLYIIERHLLRTSLFHDICYLFKLFLITSQYNFEHSARQFEIITVRVSVNVPFHVDILNLWFSNLLASAIYEIKFYHGKLQNIYFHALILINDQIFDSVPFFVLTTKIYFLIIFC